jgi:hypothetical protein
LLATRLGGVCSMVGARRLPEDLRAVQEARRLLRARPPREAQAHVPGAVAGLQPGREAPAQHECGGARGATCASDLTCCVPLLCTNGRCG